MVARRAVGIVMLGEWHTGSGVDVAIQKEILSSQPSRRAS